MTVVDVSRRESTAASDEMVKFKTIPHSATNLSLKSNVSKSAAEKKKDKDTYWEDLATDYARKTKLLILLGILLLIGGIVSACYFFKDRNKQILLGKLEPRKELDLADLQTATGPFFIAAGLLTMVCGFTWMQLYPKKIKDGRRAADMDGCKNTYKTQTFIFSKHHTQPRNHTRNTSNWHQHFFLFTRFPSYRQFVQRTRKREHSYQK